MLKELNFTSITIEETLLERLKGLIENLDTSSFIKKELSNSYYYKGENLLIDVTYELINNLTEDYIVTLDNNKIIIEND